MSQEPPWESNTGCNSQGPADAEGKPALKAAYASHVPIARKTVFGETLRQLSDGTRVLPSNTVDGGNAVAERPSTLNKSTIDSRLRPLAERTWHCTSFFFVP